MTRYSDRTKKVGHEIKHFLATMCLHINKKVHMSCDLNFIDESEGLLKVMVSHLYCKSCDISETVLD